VVDDSEPNATNRDGLITSSGGGDVLYFPTRELEPAASELTRQVGEQLGAELLPASRSSIPPSLQPQRVVHVPGASARANIRPATRVRVVYE
jgi:hypothetical protein